ncbi:MAG: hypothetical protein Q8M03_15010 [Legionella sp.]|nr:hypothetical protein [Legionella sp.]
MEPLPILRSIRDHFFEINKIDLVMGYFAGRNNNRKEVKKFIEQLGSQDPTLLVAIFENVFHSYYYDRIRLKKQMKEVFINKIRHDFIFLQASMDFLSIVLFTNNIFATFVASGSSILQGLLTYYLILPALLRYIVHTDQIGGLIDEYIDEKISSYKELFRYPRTSIRSIKERVEELKRDDYKHLFFQINHSDKKEIPSLMYLTAFYIKNNTDIDVNGSAITRDCKEYINHLDEIVPNGKKQNREIMGIDFS